MRAPTKTYVIHAREEASAPDVIVDTFTLFDANVYALIYPGSTHFYICTTLVSEKNMDVESTDCGIKVTNPLGHSVVVDLVCKQCPLIIQNHVFSQI